MKTTTWATVVVLAALAMSSPAAASEAPPALSSEEQAVLDGTERQLKALLDQPVDARDPLVAGTLNLVLPGSGTLYAWRDPSSAIAHAALIGLLDAGLVGLGWAANESERQRKPGTAPFLQSGELTAALVGVGTLHVLHGLFTAASAQHTWNKAHWKRSDEAGVLRSKIKRLKLEAAKRERAIVEAGDTISRLLDADRLEAALAALQRLPPSVAAQPRLEALATAARERQAAAAQSVQVIARDPKPALARLRAELPGLVKALPDLSAGVKGNLTAHAEAGRWADLSGAVSRAMESLKEQENRRPAPGELVFRTPRGPYLEVQAKIWLLQHGEAVAAGQPVRESDEAANRERLTAMTSTDVALFEALLQRSETLRQAASSERLAKAAVIFGGVLKRADAHAKAGDYDLALILLGRMPDNLPAAERSEVTRREETFRRAEKQAGGRDAIERKRVARLRGELTALVMRGAAKDAARKLSEFNEQAQTGLVGGQALLISESAGKIRSGSLKAGEVLILQGRVETVMPGGVMMVLSDGLGSLFNTIAIRNGLRPDTTTVRVFVKAPRGLGAVDGDHVLLGVRAAGTYPYTTVLGARAVVRAVEFKVRLDR